jgi:hypothetical protein
MAYGDSNFISQFGSQGSGGGGGSANTIYNADDTIGSGRIATLTDNLTFSGGETKFSNIATSSSPSFNSSLGTIPNIANVVGVFSFDGTTGSSARTTLYVQNNISGGATSQFGITSKVNGWVIGVETASIVAENGGGNLSVPTNSDVGLLSGFTIGASNKNATSYGIYCSNTGRISTTNYGAFFEASSTTNNYAIVVPFAGGNVGFGTITPDASAILELSTNQQGFLPPRMTTTQRDLINSGTFADGLIVYNSTTNTLQYYNGTAWTDASGGASNTLYSASDTIGSGRVATLTDTLEFRSGQVGIGTTSIDSSAILQVDSTTQGLLPPRMTTTEMNAISTPASGLMVFDRTTSQWMGYNGTSWVILG